MKLTNYIYIMGMALLCGSCASDYLDVVPESSAGKVTIFESVENARLAINGIGRMMYRQYISTQGFNGEGAIKTLYGNYPGNDFQKCNLTGWQKSINSGHVLNNTIHHDYFPWYYYYKLIGNANSVVLNIDAATGKVADKQFIKAQALTVRAYAYTMLSQLYCSRWQDSNNGATRGLPLRLDESTGDLAPSTLTEVYSCIYKDLDDAIALYTSSKQDRSDVYTLNLDVAYCVYARAALVREDWKTASQYASLARKNYPLMSVDQYKNSGFNAPNKEWIWCSDGSKIQSLHYYGFFAYQGSNANTSICRTHPCAISKELYEQIPETDIRRSMFLAPVKGDGIKDYSLRVTKGSLYNRAKKDYGAKLYSTSYIFPYMQFKFQCAEDYYGCGDVNHFRASEMYLIEAEAYCHLNEEGKVRDLLKELIKDSGRNPEYVCTKSGDELLAEVRLYRRIELWGEGFDWFDYKRWKLPRVRKTSEQGGSFKSNFAGTLQPSDANGWTWVYPYKETAYNGAFSTGPDMKEQ
ncbi:SusD-like starch-binding protein associating with outer membrane [Bacteroides zoogleoformans]|uniref:RagB/SusD family nutrient uptake outer membrane protein n=1 Tax=Bacteroides zoogleoformans TaxID=28119 RepID=A0ABN5IL18_9BACE|nr:RagB/SusD family nutrient uptake outer membrane protein [Bacteroides zoogleoformans]AVM52393.1 RagB/SusD family nutrient uptake outer membrane protein [Bacteroides zoogleoformans]TWJ13359.1 SusD-like starch-binding protein associating with outer membrane [Bacteroides zoogleoformans]